MPQTPSVAMIVGSDVDASACPPAYERSRYVADMLLHYSCRPFFRASEDMRAAAEAKQLQQEQDRPKQQRRLSHAGLAGPNGGGCEASLPDALSDAIASQLTPTARMKRRVADMSAPNSPHRWRMHYSGGSGDCEDRPGPALDDEPSSSFATALESLSIWHSAQPPSDVFTWYNTRFPPVGAEELSEFHDKDYIKYLAVRESLSDVDERAACAKREHANAMQPPMSRQTSTRTSYSASAGAAPPPPPPSDSSHQDESRGCHAPPFLTAADVSCVNKHGINTNTGSNKESPGGEVTAPPLRQLTDLIPIPRDDYYGLVQDAAPFMGLWRSVQATVSGTLTAVRWLHGTDGTVGDGGASTVAATGAPTNRNTATAPPIERFAALHWFGGRHHAKREAAAGFCFANDVVLGAMALRRGLPLGKNSILIIDIDAHHGDGQQEAFLYDDGYYTLSVHGHGTGMFPGTGGSAERGRGPGAGFCGNVPLPEGATDTLFVPLARNAIRAAVRTITGDTSPSGSGTTAAQLPLSRPELSSCLGGIVLVCGSDGVQGDAVGRLNYSVAGVQCVARLVTETAHRHGARLLVLGAGGYVNTTAARVAAVVTRDVLSAATAARLGLPERDLFLFSPFLKDAMGVAVPETCDYFAKYGPSFLMHGAPDALVPRVRELLPDAPCYAVWKAFSERAAVANRHGEGGKEEEGEGEGEAVASVAATPTAAAGQGGVQATKKRRMSCF